MIFLIYNGANNSYALVSERDLMGGYHQEVISVMEKFDEEKIDLAVRICENLNSARLIANI